MTTRPAWFNADLFPVESRWVEICGHTVHYVDEGEGPLLLMLHGNPTWSFLYRRLIAGLKDRFRCVALDYPGFGLSAAKPGYDFTPAAHADVLSAFITELDLRDITPIVQDWGGPIGLAAATRDPDRFAGLIIGNTWAWPHDTKTAERFSFLMGSEKTGDWLSRKLNLFVGQIIPRSMRRRSLKPAEMAMYKGPFPDEDSRIPVQVFPREIMGSHDFLAELESKLARITGLPSLLMWANKDMAFGKPEMERWQSLLENHHFHVLQGAGHYWQDDAGEEAVLAIRNWWDHIR